MSLFQRKFRDLVIAFTLVAWLDAVALLNTATKRCLFNTQARAAGSKRQQRPTRVWKITPSVPTPPHDVGSVPAAVAAAAAGCMDAAQLKLQKAFLDLYSTSEHKVSVCFMASGHDALGSNSSSK